MQAYMISCKIFFQLMVTAFKENPSLQLNFYFTIVLGLYLKQYLFQNKLQRTDFGSFQRLVTNLSPSLIFLAIWFCSSGLKNLGKFHSGQIVLLEKSQFVPQELRMKLIKYGGRFFIKKLRMGQQTFLGKLIGECFTQRLLIMQQEI